MLVEISHMLSLKVKPSTAFNAILMAKKFQDNITTIHLNHKVNLDLRKIPQPSFIWHHRARSPILFPVSWLGKINLFKFEEISWLKF